MKIGIRILLVGIALVGMNFIYKSFTYDQYTHEHAWEAVLMGMIQNCEIVYLSASSNFSQVKLVHEDDPRKISQFIQDFFPDLQIDAINKPASHAETHLKLLSMIPPEAEVQTIVATLNLRSFGPDWVHSHLESALNQQEVFYNDRPVLLNRFLVSLNAYDNKTEEERLASKLKDWSEKPLPYPPPKNTVSSWCAIEKWGDWRDPKRQLADQFIKQYAFTLDENHPRVKNFDEMAALANERGWNLVLNILPENIEKADSLAGNDLTGLMKQNRDWLVQRYASQGIIVVDNLELLGDEFFTDKDFPTEHYNDVGRKRIAEKVAQQLRSIHPDQFKEPQWTIHLQK